MSPPLLLLEENIWENDLGDGPSKYLNYAFLNFSFYSCSICYKFCWRKKRQVFTCSSFSLSEELLTREILSECFLDHLQFFLTSSKIWTWRFLYFSVNICLISGKYKRRVAGKSSILTLAWWSNFRSLTSSSRNSWRHRIVILAQIEWDLSLERIKLCIEYHWQWKGSCVDWCPKGLDMTLDFDRDWNLVKPNLLAIPFLIKLKAPECRLIRTDAKGLDAMLDFDRNWNLIKA